MDIHAFYIVLFVFKLTLFSNNKTRIYLFDKKILIKKHLGGIYEAARLKLIISIPIII